jgi:hypothetical protein
MLFISGLIVGFIAACVVGVCLIYAWLDYQDGGME